MYQTLGTAEAPQGLYDLPAMANTNNPRDNAGFTEMEITRKKADAWRGISDHDRTDLARWVRDNCRPVRDEVAELFLARVNDPIGYARRVTVMAILSAQVDFAENLYCTRRIIELHAAIQDLSDDEPRCLAFIESLLVAPYKGHGKIRRINGYRTKARYMLQALPFLRDITPDHMTLENLNRLRGVGPKVAAFTMALWDATAPVFTLDSWMMRLAASILGLDTRIRPSITREAYALIEGDWLAWCHRMLPDLPPFVVQWTLWNGCFGYHRSHLDIIR